jgi:para-aminobenzoate synthetase/4-amino-4-deoxychorismate lyase
VLEAVQAAVKNGWYAAGGIAYEASSAFDPALAGREETKPPETPLIWFGLYRGFQSLRIPAHPESDYQVGRWQSGITKEEYLTSVDHIRGLIASGDCYQANYTFPMSTTFSGNAWPYFLRLIEAHRCRYGALLHMGQTLHCSASPELFFERRGEQVLCRPMKGTCERGLTAPLDREKAAWLEHSQKNRAENVMILDMIRNDLGRVAEFGSVQVPSFFEVEPYPTVHQMTSTAKARTGCSQVDLFKALFPCASITGAPKKRCMEILKNLEPHPRGYYTGCLGFMTPSGYSRFSVAIRTVSMDVQGGQATFGTGSGIVWDSEPEKEYRECLSKVRFLNSIIPQFRLLESLYGDGMNGFRLLDLHLQRLEEAAEYFSMSWNEVNVRTALNHALETDDPPSKFRLLLDRQGSLEVTKEALTPASVWTLALARKQTSSTNPFLYHKTTYRKPYQEHIDAQPAKDDILLYNERMELTESCRANLVLTLEGKKFTPPVRCGLLNGTLRQELLAKGEVEEKVLYLADLQRAEKIQLINSVRGWIEVSMETSPSLEDTKCNIQDTR